ncbi:MAG: Glutaredoxin [Parcubacteria group bacterium GW2011_GWF2_38_76]|nr:MAG: Glutaredoxin [Parcubacteria group bacterium GW2011_GWF2_38_76]HBM45716.1 NrdH-redoxin [Patescibacteria group bacterium]
MKSVIIYSTNSCMYCRMAKDFFKDNKVEYTEKDVYMDENARNEMIKMTGQSGVPVIKIGEEIVIGFDKATIKELLGL